MTDGTPPMLPGGTDRDQFALQFALGLLDGGALASAIDLYRDDPQFAATVDRFEGLLAEEAGAAPADAQGDAVWQRIAGGLGETLSPVHAAPAAANDDRPAPARPLRTAALAATVAALTFGALWLAAGGIGPRPASQPTPTQPAPTLQAISVAQITAKDEPIIALAYDRGSGKLRARYLAPADPARVPELWLIGGDGKPVSLGFVTPGAATVIVIPPDLRDSLVRGATIAISLEQPSDTRHAAPAGPILGTAKVSAI